MQPSKFADVKPLVSHSDETFHRWADPGLDCLSKIAKVRDGYDVDFVCHNDEANIMMCVVQQLGLGLAKHGGVLGSDTHASDVTEDKDADDDEEKCYRRSKFVEGDEKRRLFCFQRNRRDLPHSYDIHWDQSRRHGARHGVIYPSREVQLDNLCTGRRRNGTSFRTGDFPELREGWTWCCALILMSDKERRALETGADPYVGRTRDPEFRVCVEALSFVELAADVADAVEAFEIRTDILHEERWTTAIRPAAGSSAWTCSRRSCSPCT